MVQDMSPSTEASRAPIVMGHYAGAQLARSYALMIAT